MAVLMFELFDDRVDFEGGAHADVFSEEWLELRSDVDEYGEPVEVGG